MSRKRPADAERWSVRFELRSEVSGEARLHEYLDKLAATDEVSQWIRATLVAALPAEYKDEAQRTYTAPTPMKPISSPRPLERTFTPVPKPGKGK